jgi:minor extracellular serine protease Vpr
MKKIIVFPLLCFLFSLSFAQGPALRAAIRLDQAIEQYEVSGEGVVVVMLDRGIDYRHPDFIDESGNTRIAYIFDMTNDQGANDANNPYGVGTIFTRQQIDASLDAGGAPLTTDRGGHGTATTGIMVGNGSGTTDGQYRGVAPGATIISVKLTQDPFPAFGDQPGQSAFFNANYIPIALEFAADKIEELGLPSVTLMNIGSIGGPTDGTSTISRAIDDFVAKGHPFVCGVGDDGGGDNYASGNIAEGQTVELLIEKAETGFLRMDLWYSEQDRFTVSVERPNGEVEGPFMAPAGPDAVADQTNLGDIFLYHRGANTEFFGATSDRREILMDLTGPTGTYKLILQGADINDGGVFQATLNPSRFSNNNRFGSYVVAGHSINDYSSAQGAISPGDYVVTNSYTNIDGNLFGNGGAQGLPGEIWSGSSAGPTHDGRLGIDFTTPGELAIGAYSPDTYYANFRGNIVEQSNGLYGIQNAVSAAAPVATGIIALMLELKPDLSPDQLLSLLHDSCLSDEFTGEVPNHQWGYGKLDALLALENTNKLTSAPEVLTAQDEIKVYPNPFSDQLIVESDGSAVISGIQVFNALGQEVWATARRKEANYVLPLQGLEKGMYVVLIHREEGVPLVGKVIKE